jgi:hypothetical protein
MWRETEKEVSKYSVLNNGKKDSKTGFELG